MSFEAMAWAWEQLPPAGDRVSTPLAKLVLMGLANYADQGGRCWPSHGQLAERMGVDRRTVGRVVRHLTDVGLIEARHQFDSEGQQTRNSYQLQVGQGGGPQALPGGPVQQIGVGHRPYQKNTVKLQPVTTPLKAPPQVDEVWAAYQRHHPTSKLDAKRRAMIERALKLYPVDQLVVAIDQLHRDPHNLGQNDRGKPYLGLHLAIGSAEQIERRLRDAEHVDDRFGLRAAAEQLRKEASDDARTGGFLDRIAGG